MVYLIFFKVCHACNFIKKAILAQVFSCEFCEISKNTFFYRTPPVSASVIVYFIVTKRLNVIITISYMNKFDFKTEIVLYV